MLPIKEYLANPRTTAVVLLEHFGQWLPDKIYLKIMFRVDLGYRLDLNAPKTFCEKLQWLKIYDRNPKYTIMVDKYAVKNYVASIIGKEHIIPTFGVWDTPEEIDWNVLPQQFVLKTTHGGGGCGVVICRDKNTLDISKVINKLKFSLSQDIYKGTREWPYKNVPRRVIAEQFINPCPNVQDLPDYKWYCFNGEPKFCQVIQDRTTNETIDFFDTNWKHQEFVGLNPKVSNATIEPKRPTNLETQVHIARKLSKGIPFSRIDLYETNNQIYFGEITFYPASGFGFFTPKQYNVVLGTMLKLPFEQN